MHTVETLRTMLRRAGDLMRISRDEPKLVVAQFKALSGQVPVLHAILSVDALAVAYTHYGVAPDWMTIYPLGLLLSMSAARMLMWARRIRSVVTVETAARQLEVTNWMAGILGSGFTLWAVMLSRYGDATTQMHALFFLTITMIGCVFCLMHLRSATIVIGLLSIAVLPYFAMSDSSVVRATAINFAAISAVLMFMQTVFYRDFCNLVRLSEENLRIANVDALTGLPNRRSFFSRLDRRFAQARDDGGQLTIGMIDLDGFKPVNDTYGHQAGDDVLCEVGVRLERIMAGVGEVARLGGDEFGLLIEGEPDLAALGAELCAALQVPYALRGAVAQVGASIGFAHVLDVDETWERLLDHADYALYHAKSSHRGGAVVFAREHETRLRNQGIVEQALRHACLEDELDLVYQAIVNTTTMKVVAFEALARWDSPRLGRVSPADFIPVAERAGLMKRITPVLLDKALRAMRDWPDDVTLSFNLSAKDLACPESLARIAQLVASSAIAPTRIVFEVTETAMMRDFVEAQQALSVLKSGGVEIALDDFGTGYSSLSYVHRLPLDKLKIDRSFTLDIDHDATSRDIVRSIVDLSRNLRTDCIIEGVETLEHMAVLRSLGCVLMQGYLFHKPMHRSGLADVLAGPLTSASASGPISVAA